MKGGTIMTGQEYYNDKWLRRLQLKLDGIKREDCCKAAEGFNKYMETEGTMIRTRDKRKSRGKLLRS